MLQCLCLYAQEFEDFRIQELKSICEIFDIEVDIQYDVYTEKKPYLFIGVNGLDDVQKILSRSILLKSISELYINADSYKSIGEKDSKWKEKLNACFRSGKETFKFEVDVFNKKVTLQERVEHIEEIQKYIVIPGEVDLKSPDVTFSMALDFDENELKQIYFGRMIGTSQRCVINKYSLKDRYFIGNTSMDPQLSLIMANQAQIVKGCFCYDPFVGTGSIIVACSHFGGVSGGGDIDYNTIYGRGKSSRAGLSPDKSYRSRDELIRTNFEHYNLNTFYWEIIASDATHNPFRVTEIFDAIVTDPPYGIREGGRKLGSKKDTTWDIPDDVRDEHIPAKRMHTLSSIMVDLFEFAFKYLVVGGRLVYWLPIYKPSYSEETIPRHPGFTLLGNSEQHLTKTISRRLITMKKIKALNEEDSTSYKLNKEEWKQQQNDFRKNYFNANNDSQD